LFFKKPILIRVKLGQEGDKLVRQGQEGNNLVWLGQDSDNLDGWDRKKSIGQAETRRR
jgi:hypothetical protein